MMSSTLRYGKVSLYAPQVGVVVLDRSKITYVNEVTRLLMSKWTYCVRIHSSLMSVCLSSKWVLCKHEKPLLC